MTNVYQPNKHFRNEAHILLIMLTNVTWIILNWNPKTNELLHYKTYMIERSMKVTSTQELISNNASICCYEVK